MDYYAITVKCFNTVTQSDYVKTLNKINRFSPTYCKMHRYVFERNNRTKGYHMHGLMSMDKNFYRKRMFVKGFYYFFKKIESQKDKMNWESYMNKDIYRDNNILNYIDAKELFSESKDSEDRSALEK